jgi:hypothetical protein
VQRARAGGLKQVAPISSMGGNRFAAVVRSRPVVDLGWPSGSGSGRRSRCRTYEPARRLTVSSDEPCG